MAIVVVWSATVRIYVLWYVCVMYFVFLVAKTESVESDNELARTHTHTHVRLVSNENEHIKNAENTEIEYVRGFKQHYVVASIGFSGK